MTKRKLDEHLPPAHTLTHRSGYYNADATNPYQQDGGYYDGHQQGYHDEYYNEQYYDQGAPAAGQHQQYGQNGYGYVKIHLLSIMA